MRAVLCKRFVPPSALTLEEIAAPCPAAGQVLIDVRACGVNFPDTLIVQGLYQVKPPFPFSPGAEVAGVVAGLGPGVEGLALGDRVIATTTFGGFAEQVLAQATRVWPLPEPLDFVSGAALLVAHGTALHALADRGALQAGETVLVLGAAGGVGLAAVDIAHRMGGHVIAAASSDDKLALCRAHGAADTIDYQRENLRERLKQITGGRGVDVVFDPIGGPVTEAALRSMAWRGRLLVVGFAAGGIPRIPLNLPLLKGCAIVGVLWGAFLRDEPQRAHAELMQLWKWVKEDGLRPHLHRVLPLERFAEALEEVMERRVAGKIVLTMQGCTGVSGAPPVHP